MYFDLSLQHVIHYTACLPHHFIRRRSVAATHVYTAKWVLIALQRPRAMYLGFLHHAKLHGGH
jgi:hypothetical protein